MMRRAERTSAESRIVIKHYGGSTDKTRGGHTPLTLRTPTHACLRQGQPAGLKALGWRHAAWRILSKTGPLMNYIYKKKNKQTKKTNSRVFAVYLTANRAQS